jgi:hypothetical protein
MIRNSNVTNQARIWIRVAPLNRSMSADANKMQTNNKKLQPWIRQVFYLKRLHQLKIKLQFNPSLANAIMGDVQSNAITKDELKVMASNANAKLIEKGNDANR